MFNEQFNFCDAEISLNEIIISVNSETNKKYPGNDGLTAEFYKQFLYKLTPVLLVLLDVYNSWRKLDIMVVISRTRISIIFLYRKRMIKKILQNY